MKPSLIFTEMTNHLAEDFIKQTWDYVKSIHNYDDYIKCCGEIENAILERDFYNEDTGEEYNLYFGEEYLDYISEEWWEKFGDLSNKEQEEVMKYIQDVWRI